MTYPSRLKPKPVPTHKRDSFAAEVIEDNGKKKVKILAEWYYQHAVNKLKVGDKVTLIIEQKKWKRSIAQNSYYWGVYLPIIARETGEGDIERLNALFRGKFLTTGIFDVLGQKVRVTKSASELSVGEFCEYILNIQNDTEIEAPPTENYELDSLTTKPKAS